MTDVLTSFSFENVSVLIDGEAITGFWEGDDAVQIERNKAAGNAITGVDGASVVSRPVDRTRNITLRVSPNSTAQSVLQNKLRSIEANLIADFTISVTDTGNGEGGSAQNATIINSPGSQLGENATSREWVIFAADWVPNEINYALS